MLGCWKLEVRETLSGKVRSRGRTKSSKVGQDNGTVPKVWLREHFELLRNPVLNLFRMRKPAEMKTADMELACLTCMSTI